jgi:hypothetical protein
MGPSWTRARSKMLFRISGGSPVSLVLVIVLEVAWENLTVHSLSEGDFGSQAKSTRLPNSVGFNAGGALGAVGRDLNA